MPSRLVEMTRVRGMGRLPQLLEDAVGFGRAERVFADTAMPFSPIEHPDAPMPMTTMVDLFEISGSAVGDRCFGLRVGLDMGHLGFGKMTAFAAQAPRRVSMPYADDGGRRELQDILACDWFFSRKGVAVELGESDLYARRRRTPGASGQQPMITSCDILASVIRSECGDAVDTIESLIQLRLLDGNVDIEILARLAGVSTRSLQRQLHLSGTTYREIVQRARMRRAAALISESCLTLTDISLSLGYSDPGNFSRAFRNHFGRSPSSLRRCG